MAVYRPEIECATRSYIKAVESQRLIKMVERAYNNVPFYKQLLDKAGIKPSDITWIDD